MRATLEEKLEYLDPERDPRVTRFGDLADALFLEMDDAGGGEFAVNITIPEAAELIACGLARDAR